MKVLSKEDKMLEELTKIRQILEPKPAPPPPPPPKGLWNELAVGTFIVPPEGSINIQDVVIRNLTDADLEFWVRGNEKLRELAVSKIK